MVVVEGPGAGRHARTVKPTFFKTQAALRRWLAAHHSRSPELWVGFFHRASGKGGITYPQALEEALCVGWIDGVRRNYDATSYVIRFTPRKQGSSWSLVNLRLVRRLVRRKRMRPAGLAAYRARKESRTYTSEARARTLAPAYRRLLEGNAAALAFFESQPPWFRRSAVAWVMTAKQEETRLRRLESLIQSAARGQRPRPFILPRAARAVADATERKVP